MAEIRTALVILLFGVALVIVLAFTTGCASPVAPTPTPVPGVKLSTVAITYPGLTCPTGQQIIAFIPPVCHPGGLCEGAHASCR